ncbi:MAG: DUF3035 domain-containing protein [Pseudomonadota bacterium]
MRIAVICILMLLMAACGRRDGAVVGDISNGPDPFSVMPNRALEQPNDYSSLPVPTPGAPNRADLRPRSNAIIALGGRPGVGVVGDPALLSFVTRNGVSPDIRSTLQGDASDRGLFRRNGAVIDAYAELQRFRALGVATPTAPPAQ